MLIVPDPQEEVTLVVPAVRALDISEDAEPVVLVVYDSTSHAIYDGEVGVTDIHPFAFSIDNIRFGLPNGQYIYRVYQDSETPISEGIFQCGLTAPSTQSHNYQPEVIRYER